MKVKKVLTKTLKKAREIVKIDENEIKHELKEIIRSTVEDTINGLLDGEADMICNAERYERSNERKDTRAGHYSRKLDTNAGKISIQMPKLRQLRFETAIIERYKRRETSIEEALVEMYVAGVSVRRVTDITEALWGTRVSPSTISNLNKKLYKQIERWRTRAITEKYPYLYLDGIYLKKSWGGEVRNISILVAVGVNEKGYRKVLGVAEGAKEDKESWSNFIRDLKVRGLAGVRLFISDKCYGLIEAFAEHYPKSQWQRCIVHFYRNVFTMVPRGKIREVAHMIKTIHSQEDHSAALQKVKMITEKLNNMKLKKAAQKLNDIEETLTYMYFPYEHWQNLRTNNLIERIMREIRRRTRVIGSFPDGESALMLVAARLRDIENKTWNTWKYLSTEHLYYY